MRPLWILTIDLLLAGLAAPACSDRDVPAVGWRDPTWPCETGYPVCRSGCGEGEMEVGRAESREGAWRCPPATWLRCSSSPARACIGDPPAEDGGRDAAEER